MKRRGGQAAGWSAESKLTGRYLDVAFQHRREHLIETAHGLPRQPTVTTRGTLLHGHFENQRDLACRLGHLGSPDRNPVLLAATLT